MSLYKFSLNETLVEFDYVVFQGPGWDYETELPEWAKVDWIDSDPSG